VAVDGWGSVPVSFEVKDVMHLKSLIIAITAPLILSGCLTVLAKEKPLISTSKLYTAHIRCIKPVEIYGGYLEEQLEASCPQYNLTVELLYSTLYLDHCREENIREVLYDLYIKYICKEIK